MSFRIQSFENQYAPEVVALIEKIQVGEFNFYEKHGFHEIGRKEMPSYCQPMDCDEKFYRFDLLKETT